MKRPYILIMAGGSGTRLWPLSRRDKPKQLLSLFSPKSLMEETLDRSLLLTKKKNIFIGTNQKLKKAIQKKVRWLKSEQFIVEPEARNTAPIISLFCAWLKEKKKDLDRPVVVLAADHFISPSSDWAQAVRSVFPFLHERIFCMGIEPSRPDTGYGYIETSGQLKKNDDRHLKVSRFTEKPDSQTAKKYVESGRHYWNSGIFIFSAETFLRELKIHAPEIHSLSIQCAPKNKALRKYFPQMPNISIDYALMEKTKHLGVVKGSFQWDDIGSFLALERIREKDEQGNIISKKVHIESLGAKDNIIFSDHQEMKFALLGVENLIIAKQDGVCLIADKKAIDQIKELREKFSENDR